LRFFCEGMVIMKPFMAN